MADYRNIDKILSDKLSGHSVQPTDQVWQRIAAVEPKSIPFWRKERIAAVFLFALMGISGLLNQTNLSELPSVSAGIDFPVTASDNLFEASEKGIAQNERSDKLGSTKATSTTATTSFKELLTSALKDDRAASMIANLANLIDKPSTSTTSGSALNSREDASGLPGVSIYSLDHSIPDVLADLQSQEVTDELQFISNTMAVANAKQQEAKSKSEEEWYIGTHSSVSHTSLLNGMTPSSNENFNDQFNLGAAYGLSLGYRLSRNISLETSLVLNSSQGAEYTAYARLKGELIEVDKRLKLEYTQIPVSIKVKRWLGSSKAALNYVAGVQYGYLRESSFSIAGRSISPEQRQRHDFAVLMGVEYDYTFSDRFFMSAGVRGSYSANATSAADLDALNPEKRNLVVGLRAGINYVLPGS